MKEARLWVTAVSILIGLNCNAQAQNNPTKVSDTSKPAAKPPVVIIPPVNRNALTPADKNFGGTSIYLIDKKLKDKQYKSSSKAGSINNPTLHWLHP